MVVQNTRTNYLIYLGAIMVFSMFTLMALIYPLSNTELQQASFKPMR